MYQQRIRDIAVSFLSSERLTERQRAIVSRNKTVIDRRLRPGVATYLKSYFKHMSFSCRSRCLQLVFLRAKHKAACEPHCLSLAGHPRNRKYVTYQYAVRGGPSLGRR